MASCSHCAERCAQHLFDLAGDAAQLLDQRDRLRYVERAAQLAQLDRQQKQRGQLRGKGLGGSHANLRAGVRVDGAVGLARHHGVHHVADGHGLGAERDHLALRGQRIGGFAGLGDEQAQRIAVGDGIAIAVFAGVVHIDGQAGQPLDHIFAGQAGVPTGAAGGDVDALAAASSWSVIFISPRKTLPESSETRPSVVSGMARGCSHISLSMKCL